MRKFKPSNAILPARIVDTNAKKKLTTEHKLHIKTEPNEDESLTNKEQKLIETSNVTDPSKKAQNALDSDEETISAFESDEATLTADDSDLEIDSDSTVLNDKNSRKKRRCYIFKIKDDITNPHQDMSVKSSAPISSEERSTTTSVTVKQKQMPKSSHKDAINEPSAQNDRDNVKQCPASDVIIKKEKDSEVSDTCESETSFRSSPKKGIAETEVVTHIVQNSVTENNSECDKPGFECSNLANPKNDAHNQPDSEAIDELSVRDPTEKSRKVNEISGSLPIVKTEELNCDEVNNSVLPNCSLNSVPCTKIMEACSTNSACETSKSADEISENISDLSVNNLVNNASENPFVSNEMNNSKADERNNFPTYNCPHIGVSENENDLYLYGCEITENRDAPSNSSNFSCQSHSPVTNCYEMVSQIFSPFHIQSEITSNKCMSSKEKTSEFLTVAKSSSTTELSVGNGGTVTASQEKRMYYEDDVMPPLRKSCLSSADSESDSAADNLAQDLLEFSKRYLNFNKSDIEKCLNYINTAYGRKESSDPFFCLKKFKMRNQSEKPNVFLPANTEMESMPCTPALSDTVLNSKNPVCAEHSDDFRVSPLSAEDSREIGETEMQSMAVLRSLVNEDSHDKNRYGLFSNFAKPLVSSSTEIQNEILNIFQKTVQHIIPNSRCSKNPEKSSSNEVFMGMEVESVINNSISKTCDQNSCLVFPSTKKGENDFNKFSLAPEVTGCSKTAVTFNETSNVESDNYQISSENISVEIQSTKNDVKDCEIRFNRIMSHVVNMGEAPETRKFSENVSSEAIQSFTVNNSLLSTVQIKQEKIDPITDSSISDVENISMQLNPELTSADKSTSIPSIKASETNTCSEDASSGAVGHTSFSIGSSFYTPNVQIKQEKPDFTSTSETSKMSIYSESTSSLSVCSTPSSIESTLSTESSSCIPTIQIKQEKVDMSDADYATSPSSNVENTMTHLYPELSCTERNIVNASTGAPKSTCFENKSSETVSRAQLPTKSSACIPPIQIKQEKIDPVTTVNLPILNAQSTLTQFNHELCSAVIPSTEELQKIIETSTLLSAQSSENQTNPFKSPLQATVTVKTEPIEIKTEPPEYELITLEGETSSSGVNKMRTVPNSSSVNTDDEIQVITIKRRRSLQRRLNRVSSLSNCYRNVTGEKFKKTNDVSSNCSEVVNVSYASTTTLKKTTEMYKMKNKTDGSHPPENIDDKVGKSYCDNFIKEKIVIKIEKNDEFSNGNSASDGCSGNENIGSSLLKRTVCINNQPNSVETDPSTSMNSTNNLPNVESLNERKRSMQYTPVHEPPTKKLKTTSTTQNALSALFVSDETNHFSFASKRKALDESEAYKRSKLTSAEKVQHNIPSVSNGTRKNLVQTTISLDRMPVQKCTLTYPPASLSSTACGSNCRKASKLNDDSFITSANRQSAKEVPSNNVKCLANPASSSSDRNISSVCDETCFKTNIYGKKNRDLSDTNTCSSKQLNRDTCRPSDVPLISLGRKGRNRAWSSRLIQKSVVDFMDINDLPSLILEWNANWLYIQKENKEKKLIPPICDKYMPVKTSYDDELEYYNTYFPLHLLSIWLGISDSWEKCPPRFDAIFENQVEKPTYVKISLAAVLDITNFYSWPKREDIVLCTTMKSREESLFCRVCNVMVRDYSPPESSCLKDKAHSLKRVKFELFCAELLEIPILTAVKIQILFNIRTALIKNEALRNLNNSMKDVILDPKKNVSRWKFIPCSRDDLGFKNSMKSILDSVTSPTVQITVINTPYPLDSISAFTQLAVCLIEKNSPILIGIKSEESFFKLVHSIKNYNPILAIKKKEVKLPDELRQFTLEERSVLPGDIFKDCRVILTLLSCVYFGDFTKAFANKNLTCVLHDAHLCTEAETALLLYYDVKNLVLIGNKEAQRDMHPRLVDLGYNVSLFERFCKVMSDYASF